MISPFLVSLGVFTFLLLIAKIMELTELVVSRGVGLHQVGRLLAYTLPYFLVFTLPMATLLGVLLAFLRLSADNEITSLKASGVGLYQLLPPVAALAVVAWLATSALAIWAMPWGNRSFENLLYQIAHSKADLALKERVFLDTFPGLVLYVNRLPGQGRLEDVFVVDEREEGRPHTIIAKRGRIFPAKEGVVVLRLFEGSLHSVDPSLTQAQTANFGTYDVPLSSGSFGSGHREITHEKEMYVPELLAELKRSKPDSTRHYLVEMELQKKFSLPAACLVMALVGLPLGARARRGRSWGVVMAMLVFFAYYLMLSSAWSFGETGAYPVLVGMWAPNVLFGLLGVFMFRQANKEAPIPLVDTLTALPGMVARFLRHRRQRES
jgi:lipopolysaccharide export system permease protein